MVSTLSVWPGHAASLRLTLISVSWQSVLPVTLMETTFTLSLPPQLTWEPVCGEDNACTLQESPCGHLLSFGHTGLINYHKKLF